MYIFNWLSVSIFEIQEGVVVPSYQCKHIGIRLLYELKWGKKKTPGSTTRKIIYYRTGRVLQLQNPNRNLSYNTVWGSVV